MTSASLARHLGSLFDGGSLAGLSDRQLLDRFNRRRDDLGEAAFAAIVARHGPMVLNVCRQILADHHLAEDAFQAAFLVLARRAHSLRDPDRLAPWLHGVALRTARKARARLARHRLRERGDLMDATTTDLALHPLTVPTSPPADQAPTDRDQAETLHDAIDRLPDTFRSPIVLCYFEGLALDEAARRLRCPAGTLRSRLARARDKLRLALSRRGVALSAAALAAALEARPASAAIPAQLCDTTARAALGFAARQAAASTAAALAQEVLRAMAIHRLKAVALSLVLLATLAAGAGRHTLSAFSHSPEGEPNTQEARREPRPSDGVRRESPDPARPPDRRSPDPDPPRTQPASTRPAPGRMFVVGRVLDPSGKPVPGATVMAYAAIKQPGRANDYEKMAPAPIGRADSDGSGRFRLDATRTTSARDHMVGAVAMAPGHGAGWVEVDPNADEPAVDIALKPEQVIHGRLFDLNGRPVRGTAVEVHSMGRPVPLVLGGLVLESLDGPNFWWGHGRSRPAWPGPVTSDGEGRFTLHGIGRGVRVTLGIEDPRFARSTTTIDTDNTPGPKSVTIALEPARTVTGRVTDAVSGEPISHAQVIVWSRHGSRTTANEFEADDQGRFRANPLSADQYSVSAAPPAGQPYLSASGPGFAWPKGTLEHRVDFALRRGIVIRGKVIEEGSNRPVAGARLTLRARSTIDEADGSQNGSDESASDGTFRLALLPRPGYLIVLGPTDDYVARAIGMRTLSEGQPGGRRAYAHAFVAMNPKPGADGPELTVTLRRGGTVEGRLIGPDNRPIPSAAMIGRVLLRPSAAPWLLWRPDHAGSALNGRFEIHGLDPEAEVPIHFFEPRSRLGATARFSGRSGSDGPVTVRLQPCGTARARLVAKDGKPVARFPGRFLVSIIITPGPDRTGPDQRDQLLADEATFAAIAPTQYTNDLVSDADGRITFPALIPGAIYRVAVRGRDRRFTFQKEFTLRPGETIDLGDIMIEAPPG